MTARRKRQVLVLCAAVVGAVVGYLLMQLALGGRYDFPNRCSPQPGGGGTICTLQGYAPRSIWVDIVATCVGAATGALVAVLASRSHRASGTDTAASIKTEATTR